MGIWECVSLRSVLLVLTNIAQNTLRNIVTKKFKPGGTHESVQRDELIGRRGAEYRKKGNPLDESVVPVRILLCQDTIIHVQGPVIRVIGIRTQCEYLIVPRFVEEELANMKE